jgi:epoxyqueuosine reductase QueG
MYFTIELKENIPQEMKGKFEDWVFGCDICQDVCPWNKFSKPHNEPLFNPNIDVLSMTRKTGTKSPKKLLGGIQRFFKKNKIWRFNVILTFKISVEALFLGMIFLQEQLFQVISFMV